MKTVLKTRAVWLACGLLTFGLSQSPAWSYEVETHADITRNAYERANIDALLSQQFGLSGKEISPRGFDNRTPVDWLREGSKHEDDDRISLRYFNHFYDPIFNRGLDTEIQVFGVPQPLQGQRSDVWGLEDPEELNGQDFSYRDARKYFLLSLTEADPRIRKERLADTFFALGHVIHLIEDLASPAHTRNAPHGGQIGPAYAGPKSVVEKYLDLDGVRQNLKFDGYPIPKEGFTKPRDFWAETDPSGTPRNGPDARGLSQIINRNFVSEGTNFTAFVDGNHASEYPDPILKTADCFEESVTTTDAELRIISGLVTFCGNSFIDPNTGILETNPRMTTFSLFAKDLQELGSFVAQVSSLNALNAVSIGELTIPRAVGYSAGLLDYFFRGKLDVDLIEDQADPSILHLVGNNASDDPLVEGTLKLYADDPQGNRAEALALDDTKIANVPRDQVMPNLRFQAPEGTERFVAVYQGTLGQEAKDDTRNFPGAVIGKVLGGVRVEEIFEDFDTDRWKLRTPHGVFLLPFTLTEYELVKWGDAENVLVAQTFLGLDEPNRIEAYAVQRKAGSADLVTQDTAAGPEVVLQIQKAAIFPSTSPIALGTTVEINHTLEFRQQLVRFDSTAVFTFHQTDPRNPNAGFYAFDGFVAGPVDIETVTHVHPFTDTLALVLDPDHLERFSPDTVSYRWALHDVAVDVAGRLLGLVSVHLTFPSFLNRPRVPQPVFGVNAQGQTVPLEQCTTQGCGPLTVLLDRSFPHRVNPLLWALVELNTGQVLATTAPGPITITTSEVFERVPDWFDPNPRFPNPPPLVYVHQFEDRIGGPPEQAGKKDLGWSPMSLQLRRGEPVQQTVELQVEDRSSIAVSGWLQPDLHDALVANGLLTFRPALPRGGLGDYVLSSPQLGLGIRVISTGGGVFLDVAQFLDARRARAAPGQERLVFLASKPGRFEESFSGAVLVWDPAASRTTVLQSLPDGVHALGPATGSAVLLSTFSITTLDQASLLLPLENSFAPIVFPNEDLTRDFTLLHPRFLYNVEDFRFYRLHPPLTRTALPAPLAAVNANPSGDYHAIRLP